MEDTRGRGWESESHLGEITKFWGRMVGTIAQNSVTVLHGTELCT